MKWIDVNDDLPPTGVRVLGSLLMLEGSGNAIRDVYFDPRKGWIIWGTDIAAYSVFYWHPLGSVPPELDKNGEPIQRSVEGFPAVFETQDDSLENHSS